MENFKPESEGGNLFSFDALIDGVSGATVVVKSETASINIIFAFSPRWGFHYFIWPIAQEIHRRSSSSASS